MHRPDDICLDTLRPEGKYPDSLGLEGRCLSAYRPYDICLDTLRLEEICLDILRL